MMADFHAIRQRDCGEILLGLLRGMRAMVAREPPKRYKMKQSFVVFS